MKDENGELKMFVWHGKGVLTDYTNGQICALAHNLEEALELIKKECDYCMESFNVLNYEIVTSPKAFVQWGGG